METSKKRVLLNAEPFGFGPTSAIASFFPYVRPHVEHLAYAGEGLTLDLQKPLPYDAVYDTKLVSLSDTLKEYDVLVTALDFAVAAEAKAAGLTTIIYDPLTWYWKEIPEVVQRVDSYLCQNFLGVEERIQGEPGFFATAKIIPPLIERMVGARTAEFVLLNLGGLQNPFWSEDDALKYAQHMIAAVEAVLPKGIVLKIATSSAIARRLEHIDVGSYNTDAMKNLLSRASCAFMTPGLGNIYDAAAYELPTAWLPPANDSQGQQLALLKNNNLADASLDWNDLGVPLTYNDEQQLVLSHIAEYTRTFDQASVRNFFSQAYSDICGAKASKSKDLLIRFGSEGAKIGAEEIMAYV